MLSGFIIGTTLASVFYLSLTRRFLCRIGWHKWDAWGLSANGTSQFRRCMKCGLYDVELFRSFTLTSAPPPTPKPPCPDCLDTGFKIPPGGKVERCIHESDAAVEGEK